MEFLASVLSIEGHEVLTAPTVEEAREVLANRPDAGNICPIIDVVLQHESGIEFAHELLRQHPAVRVLFISGYTDDVLFVEPELANRTAFLGKPFNKDGLMAALERLHA
jgi:two-component system, cell cycle sensor histidine kinase and response regulator CckA